MSGAEPSRWEMDGVVAEVADGVLLITLSRPEVLNAISPPMRQSLHRALTLASREDVGAVVLTGAGRGFSAGADLKAPPPEPLELNNLRQQYHPLVLALAGVDKPVIAAINGPVAGAGLALACAADIRWASTTARFVPGFIQLALVPDCGATYHLPRIIGYGRAVEWLCSGRALPADTALEWGLVDRVLPTEELLSGSLALAAEFVAQPTPAVAATKRLLRLSDRQTLPTHLESEMSEQELLRHSPAAIAARAARAGGAATSSRADADR